MRGGGGAKEREQSSACVGYSHAARVRLTFRLDDIPKNECQLEDEPSAVYDVLYDDD